MAGYDLLRNCPHWLNDETASRKTTLAWSVRAMTNRKRLAGRAFMAPALFLALAAGLKAEGPFAIKDGDRIVFYGDSITDQRLYTTFVETYIVTRFPR